MRIIEGVRTGIKPLTLGAFFYYANGEEILFHYKYDFLPLEDIVKFEGLHDKALKHVEFPIEKKWLIANEARWKQDYKDKINEHFKDSEIFFEKTKYDPSQGVYHKLVLNNENITYSKLNRENGNFFEEGKTMIHCGNIANAIELFYYSKKNIFLTREIYKEGKAAKCTLERNIDFYKEKYGKDLRDGYNLSEIIYNLARLDN